jgi:hypothetical protein
MARMKLTARKHVHAPPCRNVVPTESHSDGQDIDYFLRTLWTVLLALGSSEHPLFIRTPRPLRGNSYLWCVRVVIYERPMINRIHHMAMWSRLLHRGGCLRLAWERQPMKHWPSCDMMRMSESKKTLNITDTRRRILAQHIFNLAWIHIYSSLRDDISQKSNLLQPKLTLP